MKDNIDELRKLSLYELSGNEAMSGAIMTDPCNPEADLGVIFIEFGGYLPMCGHDTIGFYTAVIEAGILPMKEPLTVLKLDTSAGLVMVNVTVDNSEVKDVSFKNVPYFLYYANVEVELPEIGNIIANISYGGNFYAIVDAKTAGLEIKPENSTEIVKRGVAIREAIRSSIEVQHPEKSFISGLNHVEFYAPPENPFATVKNAVEIPPGLIDRSPCGTGTSAKLAALFA